MTSHLSEDEMQSHYFANHLWEAFWAVDKQVYPPCHLNESEPSLISPAKYAEFQASPGTPTPPSPSLSLLWLAAVWLPVAQRCIWLLNEQGDA